MAFKHYNIALSIRLLLVIINTCGIGLCIGFQYSWVVTGVLLFVEILLVINLISFFNRANQQIRFFIDAVKNNDTTLHFPEFSGNAIIDELHSSLNELNNVLQDIKVKNRIREQYFSEILQHITTGIIVFNDKGFIMNINRATLELFGLKILTHISQFDRVDKSIKQILANLPNRGQRSISFHRNDELILLSIGCTIIKLKNEEVRLVTMHDIRGELERQELDSWVKLIKVLNHEIMNSLAPVTSIAQSLKTIWEQSGEEMRVDSHEISRTINGLDVIVDRGEGLMRFVRNYRMFTKIPEVNLEDVNIQAMFDRLSILVSPMKEEFGVDIKFHPVEEDFIVRIDEQMMVQVIINIVKNAAEATSGIENGKVDIFYRRDINHSTEILVYDNGHGIPENILDEVFVPFFTTKQSGTGIGLSYSRQVMRAHGGSIGVRSKEGETVFILRLGVNMD